MCIVAMQGLLCPHLDGLVLERVERSVDELVISARVRGSSAHCRRCGSPSGIVHGHYRRRVADAPLADSRVVIDLDVRRFRCANRKCEAVTFTEQVPGVTTPHSRATPLLQNMVAHIGLALAGRAGCRLASLLGITVGRDTLLRRVKALPEPQVDTGGNPGSR